MAIYLLWSSSVCSVFWLTKSVRWSNEQVRLMAHKGYAFVEFASHEAAAKAIESMHDRKIKVSLLLRSDKSNPLRHPHTVTSATAVAAAPHWSDFLAAGQPHGIALPPFGGGGYYVCVGQCSMYVWCGCYFVCANSSSRSSFDIHTYVRTCRRRPRFLLFFFFCYFGRIFFCFCFFCSIER